MDDEINAENVWRRMQASRDKMRAAAERLDLLQPGEYDTLIRRFEPNGPQRDVIAEYFDEAGLPDDDETYHHVDTLVRRLGAAGFDIVPIEFFGHLDSSLRTAESEQDRLRADLDATTAENDRYVTALREILSFVTTEPGTLAGRLWQIADQALDPEGAS